VFGLVLINLECHLSDFSHVRILFRNRTTYADVVIDFGNQQACAVHLQPRLAEFLNLAAKQLVSEILLEVLYVLLFVFDALILFFTHPYSSLLFAWQGHGVKENVSVANNACWAIGEVAIKVSPVVYFPIYICCRVGCSERVLNKDYMLRC